MSVWEGILLGTVLVCVLLIVGYSLYTGISPMPSNRKVMSAMLSLIPPSQIGAIVDLGAGWGSLLVPVARRCPHANVVGYELSVLPWFVAWLRSRWYDKTRITVVREDFFQVSLQHASVVLCYLYTGAMQRLSQTIIPQLQPGTVIISHTFSLPGWKPTHTLVVDDLYRTPIYVYHVPPMDR